MPPAGAPPEGAAEPAAGGVGAGVGVVPVPVPLGVELPDGVPVPGGVPVPAGVSAEPVPEPVGTVAEPAPEPLFVVGGGRTTACWTTSLAFTSAAICAPPSVYADPSSS